jgi:hypothetical protein
VGTRPRLSDALRRAPGCRGQGLRGPGRAQAVDRRPARPARQPRRRCRARGGQVARASGGCLLREGRRRRPAQGPRARRRQERLDQDRRTPAGGAGDRRKVAPAVRSSGNGRVRPA